MKGLLHRFRNTRLQTRLSIPVTFTLVCLISAHFMLYLFLEDVVNDNVRTSAESIAVSLGSHTNTRIRSIVGQMYYATQDIAIQEDLSHYLLREDDSSEAKAMTELSIMLSLYKAQEPLVSSVILYTPKQTYFSGGMLTSPHIEFENTRLWEYLEKDKSSVIYVPIMEDEIFRFQKQVIPIMHRFSISGYPMECVLIVNLDPQKLAAYLLEALPEDGSQVILYSEGYTPLAASAGVKNLSLKEEWIRCIMASDTAIEVNIDGKQYLAGTNSLESVPWKILYLHSTTNSARLISTLRYVFFLLIAVILGLMVCISWTTRTVTQPLGQLCDRICKSIDRHKLLDFPYPYGDEIGELAQNYNTMAGHIRHLLEEQQRYIQQLEEEKRRADEEQALKRRAELRALQAQINPHFLYNTLDSIRWKAEMAGQEDISQMTTSLATLFRIGLSRGQEIITVEQELRHVESYLKIQGMRYRDRMTYEIDVDPDILQLHTVKLLLQPLVENAIYHGIKESTHSGTVFITGFRSGDKVLLQVSDNGMGIPADYLRVLQKDLECGLSVSREGYGIFNVNERIRLHFGKGYGLRLDSQEGTGTVATVSLPCITQSEVNQYVPNYDRG